MVAIDRKKLKRDMLAHARACGEKPTKMNVKKALWGWGARRLAWRITKRHLPKASTKPAAVYGFLNPTQAKPRVVEHDWRWSQPLVRRTGNPPGTVWHHAAAAVMTPEQVHAAHLANGWAGIGYHYYVRKDGSIHRGRPEWAMGSHALNCNDSLGVCAEGNYESEKTMPAAQLASLRDLHANLHGRYKLVDKRHRDCPGNATACPGKHYPFAKVRAG